MSCPTVTSSLSAEDGCPDRELISDPASYTPAFQGNINAKKHVSRKWCEGTFEIDISPNEARCPRVSIRLLVLNARSSGDTTFLGPTALSISCALLDRLGVHPIDGVGLAGESVFQPNTEDI